MTLGRNLVIWLQSRCCDRWGHVAGHRAARQAALLPYYPCPCSPGVRRAANLSLLAVPFRPFLVSTAGALLVQTEFVRQAVTHKVGAGGLALVL